MSPPPMPRSAPAKPEEAHSAPSLPADHPSGSLSLVRVWRDEGDDREFAAKKLDLGMVKRIAAYTRPYAKKRTVLLICVALRSLQLPAMSWAVGAIISGPIAKRDVRAIGHSVLGFAALVLSTEIVFCFRSRLALELGEAVVYDLRNELFEKLLGMPMSFFGKTRFGRLIGRMTSDIDVVRTAVQDVVFVSIVQVGNMVVAAALMAYYDFVPFLVVLAVVPALWAIIRHFHVKLGQAYRQMQESFSRVTATLAESVAGVRVTQGFVRQDINGGLFRSLIYNHSRYNMEAARHSALFLPLLEFNGQLFLAMLLVVGGYQALGGHVGLAALVEFFFLANLLFNPLTVLGNQYNQALTAIAGAERVFRLLDAEPAWPDESGNRKVPRLRGDVEFRDVEFAYEPGRPVLHGIGFSVKAGQSIALVGHTGSGKSTVLNLVAKLYLATRGSITIDGEDIRSLESTSLRQKMGIVLQNNFLFSGTVRENIRFGRPDASDEQVVDAVRALDLLDLVEALPAGFDTEVGERGAGLSAGQRQIVCFARAMLSDPGILLLDEATSAIDTVTESRLQKALVTLLCDRTSFIVAHRLTTIRRADCVLVMEKGLVVERGSHAELLGRGGTYASLYREAVLASLDERTRGETS